jgi:hypothetical protein
MANFRPGQIANLLRQQGVAEDKIPTMTAIALAESSGNTQAFNPTGLDKSFGLFQVNMHGGLGPARMKQFGLRSEQELFDPTVNARAAKQILGSQGLGAWTTYTSGKYKEFLPQAQQGLSEASQKPEFQQQQQPSATTPTSKEFLSAFTEHLGKQNELLEAVVKSKKESSTQNDDPYGLKNIPIPKPVNPQDIANQMLQSSYSYV